MPHDTNGPWQEEVRKIGGQILVEVMQEILEKLDNMEKRHTKSEANIAALKEAFPSSDPSSHRRYHEEIIRRNYELRRLRVAISEKTISGCIFGALVWIFYAIRDEVIKMIGH